MTELSAAADVPPLAQPAAPSRLWTVAAWLWLAFAIVVVAHQVQFWRHGRLNTDVLALLPQTEQAPEVAQSGRVLAEGVSRQVAVLVGALDWASARRAAQQWRA
nr:hypothetical protein [Ramlibacter sp.]